MKHVKTFESFLNEYGVIPKHSLNSGESVADDWKGKSDPDRDRLELPFL